MIDMRRFFTHRAYPCVVKKFEEKFDRDKLNCKDYWFAFTDLQKKISNNRCPICEVKLTNTPNKTNTHTLDHFRPKAKDMYLYLKCEPKNYMLMCSLCNNTYKEDKFPLIDETKRVVNAKKIEDTREEQPLLFNPTEENPLDFFTLVFIKTTDGGVLELEPKSNLSEIQHQRSIAMIKMFSLSYCNEKSCTHKRKERLIPRGKMEPINVTKVSNKILRKNYDDFIKLAQAIQNKDKKAYALIVSNKNRKKKLEKYGFFNFIMKKQFSIK